MNKEELLHNPTLSSRPLNKISILGTGTSTGIPMIGCYCPVCTSTDYRNKRLRTSIFLQTKNGAHILIDTSPDLRYQALKHHITRIDSVILTHEHADHIHGIDDLRPFCFRPPPSPKVTIPVYANSKITNNLTERFPYIFNAKEIFNEARPIIGGGIPLLDLRPISLYPDTSLIPLTSSSSSSALPAIGSVPTTFTIEKEKFIFFELPHGHTTTLGFIHGKLAQVIDCSEIPENILQLLHSIQLEVLIIDCLRKRKHQTHLHLEKVLSYIKIIKPKFAGLIHLSHDLEHQALLDELQSMGYGPQINRDNSGKSNKKSNVNHTCIRPLIDGDVLEYS